MGTNVVSGTATAVVAATGNATYFGAVAKDIAGARPLTSFDKGISRVSWMLIRFLLVMTPLVFLINGITKGDWLESLLFAVSVAVGLTPEMLPMIVTTNLAKGRGGDGAAQGHRETAQCHPEFRSDGYSVHRQDRHADAEQGHP